MMKSTGNHLDGGSSEHSPSYDEKRAVAVENGEFEKHGQHIELPPDPDAGLSAEEKARIVCINSICEDRLALAD